MENKSMSTKKKLAILAGIIATIFIGVNLAWFIGVWMPYNKYTENMIPLNDSIRYYTYSDEKYDYFVERPFYLNFEKSFFKVEEKGGYKIYFDEEGNQLPVEDDFITLFIWPEYGDGAYYYGISCEREIGDFFGTVNFKIDDKLHVLSEDMENPETSVLYKEVMEDNKEQISELMKRAKDFWNIK